MKEAVVHFFPAGTLLALVGNPNCGKTALFNLLTGSRQKVANYAGVTVERKEGKLTTLAGKARHFVCWICRERIVRTPARPMNA